MTPEQARLFRLLAVNAYHAYSHTLVGNAAPKVQAAYERMTHPMPGDVVLETSTIWTWAKHVDEEPMKQCPYLGVLLRTAREPYPRDPEEQSEEVVATELVYYIRPIDGSVPEYRWTNANFIALFSELTI